MTPPSNKMSPRYLVIGLMAPLGLIACTPVARTVTLNESDINAATASSSTQATLRDDGTVLTTTGQGDINYAALNSNGTYTKQSTPIGSASIGPAGIFASDPKTTAADEIRVEYTTVQIPTVFYDENGDPYTREGVFTTTAVPSLVLIRGFNTDASPALRELVALAEADLAKLQAMEESERLIFLEEIKQRGDLYRSVFRDAANALGLTLPGLEN